MFGLRNITIGFLALLCVSASLQAQDKNPLIKVMSFNIRYGTAQDGKNVWSNRKDFVIETIKQFDPDLLGGQEVLKFQADYLLDQLNGYSFHGVGRNDGREEGEYTAIYYKKDRFRLLESGHFWLSESPERPGSVSWDSSLTRMVSWVMLDDLEDNDSTPIFFTNTHYDHRGKQARHESSKLIRRMRDKMEADSPIILTGDFNTSEDTDAYKALTNAGESEYKYSNLLDSYRIIHPIRSDLEATFSGFSNRRKGSRIDYVFHSGHFKTINAAIDYSVEDGRNPSDHYPVTAILRLK